MLKGTKGFAYLGIRTETERMRINGYDNLIFFDTETTGFDPVRNRLIEIGAVSVSEEGEETIGKLIRLPEGERLPAKITGITKITEEMLTDEGVGEREALASFFALFERGKKNLLIAHNAAFDYGFVRIAAEKYRRGNADWVRCLKEADYLDTLTVYRDRREKKHGLADAIKDFSVEDKAGQFHRAGDDAMALKEVTTALQKERDDLESYINIFGYKPEYGGPKRFPEHVRVYPQSSDTGMKPLDKTLPALVKQAKDILS